MTLIRLLVPTSSRCCGSRVVSGANIGRALFLSTVFTFPRWEEKSFSPQLLAELIATIKYFKDASAQMVRNRLKLGSVPDSSQINSVSVPEGGVGWGGVIAFFFLLPAV